MQVTSQLGINALWNSRDEKQWRDALDHYWTNPTVQRAFTIEKFMESLDIEKVRAYDVREWFEFLERYFEWKFTGNYLPQKLGYLRHTGLQKLFAVKTALFALEKPDMQNIRECLNTVRSPRIKGLQYAGASGLLAVLFPQYFGTADSVRSRSAA